MHSSKSVSALFCFFAFSTALIAQSDKGALTGSVTDPTSAVVIGASVEARNLDNGSVFKATTTGSGSFTIGALPSGKYDVVVSATGFRTANHSNVQVFLDQTIRIDTVLALGATSDTITVTAEAPMVKNDNAEQSMNVSGETVNALPLNFGGGGSAGGGIRNWLSFVILAPGVSGTGYNAPVNGLPANNFKVYLEGQDSTSNNDTNWTSSVATTSVEAITEFAVQSSNFSAQYGQVAGGLYNFTTKSGTNQYHGSAYEYWANEALDAYHPYNHKRDKDRKNDYGFSIGGPVRIPKVYNGKNHTFFFFNLERFGNNQASAAQTGTVPTAAYRSGDFSAGLVGARTLTDATSGMTFLENTIYDPATTTTDSAGRAVRTAFPGNIIPPSRFDPTSVKIQQLIPAPVNTQTTLNWIPSIVTNTKQQIPSLKIDQDFGANTKFSFFWTYQTTDQIAAPDGLPFPLSSARPKLVQGSQYRVNLDRTLSPNLISHLGVGWYRFHNPDSASPDELNYDVKGILGLVGSSTGTGFPEVQGLGYNNQGGGGNYGPGTAENQWTDKLSFTWSGTYIRGKHTYQLGAEFKQDVYSDTSVQDASGKYTFGNGPTAEPFLGSSTVGAGAIGSGYASFLLGQVSAYSVLAPKNTQLRRETWGLYFQDNWKVTRNLTLDLGLRWDLTPIGHELYDRMAEIGLHTPNPAAGGLPGGYVFAGYGAGRCNCEFSTTYPYAIGPRLAAAYQINKKTVLRAGWGVSYSAGANWAYLNGGTPTIGLGFGSVSNSTGFGYAVSQFKNGIVYDPAVLYKATLDPGGAPAPGSLSAAPAWAAQYQDPNGGRPARVNQWDISLQRQLTKDMSLEASYVANRGVWEEARNLVSLNATLPGTFANRGLDLTNGNTRTLLGSQICSTAAKTAGYVVPYASFPCTATVAQTLRPFPEYNDGLAVWFDPIGNSWYDSLQVKFTKRFSHGLDLTSNFTYQKELALAGANVNDVFNRNENKGLASSSQPFISVTAFTYRAPKFTSNKFVRQILGDWTLAGVLRYASGALIGAPSSRNNVNNITYNTATRFTRVPGQPLFLVDPNCHCIDPNNIGQQILNPAAWVDTPAGTWGAGAGYYNDYRWQHQVSENMNVGRTFQLREKMSLNIRAEFFNVFNRVYLGTPSSGNPTQTTTVNSATGAITGFGYAAIGNTSNLGGQRNGQLVARFTF